MNPVAQAQQDWRDGLPIDHNPYPKHSREASDYAWEHHRLTHEEFVRDCLEPTNIENQGRNHEEVTVHGSATGRLLTCTG